MINIKEMLEDIKKIMVCTMNHETGFKQLSKYLKEIQNRQDAYNLINILNANQQEISLLGSGKYNKELCEKILYKLGVYKK
jgi:hypothetical protein